MEVFTLCDSDNITNSYLARFKQKQITVTIKKTYSVNEPLYDGLLMHNNIGKDMSLKTYAHGIFFFS